MLPFLVQKIRRWAPFAPADVDVSGVGWQVIPVFPAYTKGQQRDFVQRLAVAEDLKVAMRRPFSRAVGQRSQTDNQQVNALRLRLDPTPSEQQVADLLGMAYALREAANRASWDFWREYDAINQLWTPEDPVYTGSRSGVTLATTTDLWTLTVGSSGQARLLESYLGGEATTSTVLRFANQFSTSGTTPTNQTPEKTNSRSPAAVSTFATAWSTQPTLSGVAVFFHAFNAFGGTDRWVPPPGAEIYLVNSEKWSGRSAVGTPVVSGHLFFEEL